MHGVDIYFFSNAWVSNDITWVEMCYFINIESQFSTDQQVFWQWAWLLYSSEASQQSGGRHTGETNRMHTHGNGGAFNKSMCISEGE